MIYCVKVKASAARALKKIAIKDRERLIVAIDALSTNPAAGGVLKGEFSGLRRLRVGDYRIVYEINELENLMKTSDYSNISEIQIYNHALALKKKILEMRRQGLLREGEFSVENLVFKKLRNEGYIEKIIELISKAYTNIYNE